jgi:NADH-ubiquinone oxidoreductase chain 1
VAQTISYEVSLALLLIRYFALVGGLRLSRLGAVGRVTIAASSGVLVSIWLLVGLAETNRTPFDFAEGESELVSGFNVEYGAGGFALIFMAEYGSILLIGALSAVLAGTGTPFNFLGVVIISGVAYFWVWARATLPRYRYDKLIRLA